LVGHLLIATAVTTNGASLPATNATRSPAEERLSDLLQRQAELAALSSPTPDQDREYGEIVTEIGKATAAVDVAKAAQTS